jgi:quercetin dioxygenase-like cupin family protein
VLYCLAGSIAFRLEESAEVIELGPGDRLDIEPGTVHSATVGATGVRCAEGALSPNTG